MDLGDDAQIHFANLQLFRFWPNHSGLDQSAPYEDLLSGKRKAEDRWFSQSSVKYVLKVLSLFQTVSKEDFPQVKVGRKKSKRRERGEMEDTD